MFNTIKVNNTDTNYTHSIFDISDYNSGATYDDLSSALAAIPESKLHGGMTVRYVLTVDNKYVQYRLMSDTWSTTVTDWQGVDDGIHSGSQSLAKSGDVATAIGTLYVVGTAQGDGVHNIYIVGEVYAYGLKIGYSYFKIKVNSGDVSKWRIKTFYSDSSETYNDVTDNYVYGTENKTIVGISVFLKAEITTEESIDFDILSSMAFEIDDTETKLKDNMVSDLKIVKGETSGYVFIDTVISKGVSYKITNGTGKYIAVGTASVKSTTPEWDEMFVSHLASSESVVVKATVDSRILKVYSPSPGTSGFTFENITSNAALYDRIEENVESINNRIDCDEADIEEVEGKADYLTNLIGEYYDLSELDTEAAEIFQYQNQLFWKSSEVASVYKIDAKKNDKITIKGNPGRTTLYCLTDKLNFQTQTAISLVDNIDGSVYNDTVTFTVPTDCYLIIQYKDKNDVDRSPESVKKYLGNIKTEIDVAKHDAESYTDSAISDAKTEIEADYNDKFSDVDENIEKKVDLPTENIHGSNGQFLMSLGNGATQWSNIDVQTSGKFYGYFVSSSNLPSDADEVGYAYVGQTAPWHIYNFDGSDWTDSGSSTYLDESRRINVKDFGAVGDGVTDDIPAIADALNYAASNLPCEVYFPKGDYGIADGGIILMLPKGSGGLKLIGDGGELSRLYYLPDYQHKEGKSWYSLRIMPVQTPSNKTEYLHDITVCNLGVYDTDPYNHALNPEYDNTTDVPHEETHGWDFSYIKRLKIENCFINSVGDECFDMNFCDDTQVVNNHIFNSPGAGNSGGAISVNDGCDGVIVANNVITNNIHSWTRSKDGSTDIVIGKRNFGINIEALENPINDVLIVGNMISDLQGTGINLSASRSGASISNIQIIGNDVRASTVGIYFGGTMSTSNIVIADNSIHDMVGYESYNPEWYSGPLEDVTVYGICCRNYNLSQLSVIGSHITNMEYGIFVSSVDAEIKNCFIKDIDKYAITLSCANPSSIDSCKIINSNRVSEQNRGAIWIQGGTVDVSNCHLLDVKSNKGVQSAANVTNCFIRLYGVGDAITLADKIVGCDVNGRLPVSKSNVIIRDCKIVSSISLGSHAVQINNAVKNVSVIGCFIDTIDYNAIYESGSADYNLICNNLTRQPITTASGSGTNTTKANNVIIQAVQ